MHHDWYPRADKRGLFPSVVVSESPTYTHFTTFAPDLATLGLRTVETPALIHILSEFSRQSRLLSFSCIRRDSFLPVSCKALAVQHHISFHNHDNCIFICPGGRLRSPPIPILRIKAGRAQTPSQCHVWCWLSVSDQYRVGCKPCQELLKPSIMLMYIGQALLKEAHKRVPEFFNIPPSLKEQCHMRNSPSFLGYTGLGAETTAAKTDIREVNQFPSFLRLAPCPGHASSYRT